jgi:hypothetical protein
MAELKNTTIDGSQYLSIPVGTTAQRPSSPEAGMIRWNTTIDAAEEYNGTSWVTLEETVKSDFNIFYFVEPGSTTWTVPPDVTEVEVVVVGGGAGGGVLGGGGGGGGVIHEPEFPVTPGDTISITVGSGGPGQSTPIDNRQGGNSVFGSLTALGGGAGSGHPGNRAGSGGAGRPGGSGGGAAYTHPSGFGAGTDGQGFPGGSNVSPGPPHACAGGGGAGGSGGRGKGPFGGHGGVGRQVGILGEPAFFGGGGGGGGHGPQSGANRGGVGGGGGGGRNRTNPYGRHQQHYSSEASDGQPGTGGGGGGGGHNGTNPYGWGGRGGPGIVIVRY